jgi:large subunit ribosomal protein L10
MSKPVKDVITHEYQQAFGELEGACVVNVVGLDAISTNKLRNEIRAKKLSMKVVRNSLARRALADRGLAPLAKALQGPCALVTGGDSIVEAAKILVALKKTYAKLELKLGLVEGDLYEVEQISKMKSRADMLGEIAMLIASPGRRLAGCINAPGGKLAGCVKTIADKSEAPVDQPAAA